ncbi:MAG: monovalent cation/H+ antiporter subunit D [Burkholderiaceae bacterium]
MTTWVHHLILLPVLLPLVCGAALIPLHMTRHRLKFAMSMGTLFVQTAVALVLLGLVDGEYWAGGIGVYLAANWAAPFGIALVADRLAVMMLLLGSIIGIAALLFSLGRWSRTGVHFHALFQFLLMGINGACLTHDLFNLFVFFEVMLAASYGLVLHGYNIARIRAGMQYIAINLVASLLFLIGLAMIYGTAGTLNMADLAGRVPGLGPDESELLKVGVVVLAIAFLTKSAMWPFGFWLPTTYSVASPPVAAMLVLMTKVGIYVVLRIWLLVFSKEAGTAAGFGYEVLFWGGIVTMCFGAIGMLASEAPGRMGGYGAIVSSGILLAVLGYGQSSLVAAGLFYLFSSTLAIAAFMLLIELVERVRTPGGALLAVTTEAFGIEDAPGEPVGIGIPGSLAFLGLGLAGCALVIAGLPPLSGFVGKFALFHALLQPGPAEAEIGAMSWTLGALLLVSGLAATISLMRFGVRTLWAQGTITPPRLLVSEAAPITFLLLACVALTIAAGPVFAYLGRTSDTLHQPTGYVDRVLGTPTVPGPLVPAQEGAGR